jgi:hypothetical protein
MSTEPRDDKREEPGQEAPSYWPTMHDDIAEYRGAIERHNARVAAKERVGTVLVVLTAIGWTSYTVPFFAVPNYGLVLGLVLTPLILFAGVIFGLFVALLLTVPIVWLARRILGQPDPDAYMDEWKGRMSGWW